MVVIEDRFANLILYETIIAAETCSSSNTIPSQEVIFDIDSNLVNRSSWCWHAFHFVSKHDKCKINNSKGIETSRVRATDTHSSETGE